MDSHTFRPQKYLFLERYRAFIRNGLIYEKWGKMGENCGKLWMLLGKMGKLGAEKAKNMVFIGNKARGWGGSVHWRKLQNGK